MPTYEISEAGVKLTELIERVQQGEHVAIASSGQVLAELVAPPGRQNEQAIEAIAAIRAMRTGAIDQKQFNAMRLSGRR